MKGKRTNGGFSLIEVIISLGILGMVAATFFPVIGWLVTRSRNVEHDSQASLVLQEGMETAYNVLLADWDSGWSKYSSGDPYHPEVQAGTWPDPDKWTLAGGDQTGVEGRYDRRITLYRICRDSLPGPTQGEWMKAVGGCVSPWVEDPFSKLVITDVNWMETGGPESLSAQYLVIRMGD